MADDYDHNHYWRAFQVKKEFIPDPNSTATNEFIAVDYAYHYCSGCGDTIKVEVKEVSSDEAEG